MTVRRALIILPTVEQYMSHALFSSLT
jgi:hypothetical protein